MSNMSIKSYAVATDDASRHVITQHLIIMVGSSRDLDLSMIAMAGSRKMKNASNPGAIQNNSAIIMNFMVVSNKMKNVSNLDSV